MKRQSVSIIYAIIFCCCIYFEGKAQNTINDKKITIGMIGKISANPVFEAAYAGARLAAKELGKKYKVDIIIDWQTPEINNAKEQASMLEKLARKSVDGIAISCSDANFLTPCINMIVAKGIPVMCFVSDAPQSKRFAYEGVDDFEFGRSIVRELANVMDGKGTIAVLAGSKGAMNQKVRLQGIKEELKNCPGISFSSKNIYYNLEMAKEAAETVRQAQKANPDIKGWAFLGSWALLEENSLPWNPNDIKIVAGYAVPEELNYVKSGHVQALIGVNCFQSGYKSVELLIDKIINNHEPANPTVYASLILVSKDNLNEWQLNWNKWLLKEAINK
jgi:ribose transport system substrate-binding protein